MSKIGFKVYKIKVSRFQIGEYQIVFTKESIIEKEDITSKVV